MKGKVVGGRGTRWPGHRQIRGGYRRMVVVGSAAILDNVQVHGLDARVTESNANHQQIELARDNRNRASGYRCANLEAPIPDASRIGRSPEVPDGYFGTIVVIRIRIAVQVDVSLLGCGLVDVHQESHPDGGSARTNHSGIGCAGVRCLGRGGGSAQRAVGIGRRGGGERILVEIRRRTGLQPPPDGFGGTKTVGRKKTRIDQTPNIVRTADCGGELRPHGIVGQGWRGIVWWKVGLHPVAGPAQGIRRIGV